MLADNSNSSSNNAASCADLSLRMRPQDWGSMNMRQADGSLPDDHNAPLAVLPGICHMQWQRSVANVQADIMLRRNSQAGAGAAISTLILNYPISHLGARDENHLSSQLEYLPDHQHFIPCSSKLVCLDLDLGSSSNVGRR